MKFSMALWEENVIEVTAWAGLT